MFLKCGVFIGAVGFVLAAGLSLAGCGFVTVGEAQGPSSQAGQAKAEDPGATKKAFLPASRAKLAEGVALLGRDPASAVPVFEALSPMAQTEAARVMLEWYHQAMVRNPQASLNGIVASYPEFRKAKYERGDLLSASRLLRARALQLAGHPEEVALSFDSTVDIPECSALPCDGLGVASWKALAEELMRDAKGMLTLEGAKLSPQIRLSVVSRALEGGDVSRSGQAVHEEIVKLKSDVPSGPVLVELQVTGASNQKGGTKVDSVYAGGTIPQEVCRDGGNIEVRGSGGITVARFLVELCHSDKRSLAPMTVTLMASGSESVQPSVRQFMVSDVSKIRESSGRVDLGAGRAVWSPPAYEQGFSFKDEAKKEGITVGGLHYFEEY